MKKDKHTNLKFDKQYEMESLLDYDQQEINKQKRKNKIDRDKAFKKSKARYEEEEY